MYSNLDISIYFLNKNFAYSKAGAVASQDQAPLEYIARPSYI
jgi:hypothetical protein